MPKKLISIVLPAYQEEQNISYIYNELLNVIHSLSVYDFEIIFVNDGSTDRTWNEIEKFCEQDNKVKWVNLSRNFGKEIALSAWVEHTFWDAVITMDSDWQRPVSVIKEFLEKWESGTDIVYGVRINMRRSLYRKIASNAFNAIMRILSNVTFESASTDFMLLDRKVVTELEKHRDKNRIFRWLVLSLGFRQSKVYFEEPSRKYGVSGWGIQKLYKLAIDSITSFSILPLKLIGYLGIFIILLSIGLLSFMTISRFFLGNPLAITNTAFFVVSNLFLSGITLVWLGVMAIYIARIHEEVIKKPLYTTQKTLNFTKDSRP